MALSNVGAASLIQSMTEDSEEARICNLWYAQSRDAALRAHAWAFATQFRVLADLGSPHTGWDYRYSYPADCLVALEIVNTVNDDLIEFEIAGGISTRVILTDEKDAELRYTARITDAVQFDAGFVEVLSWNLAYHIAESITGSSSKKNDALQIYQSLVGQMAAVDSSEGRRDLTREAPWISARL